MNKLVSIFNLAATSAAIVFLSAACSSSNEENAGSTDEEVSASMAACQVDTDCVAVDKGGCCPNGIHVAVNKHHTTDYKNSHKCTHPPQACPLAVILDTRVAQCNSGTSKCEMIAPEKIRCGGFTRNPHHCAHGYSCDFSGHVPDVPGICKKNN